MYIPEESARIGPSNDAPKRCMPSEDGSRPAYFFIRGMRRVRVIPQFGAAACRGPRGPTKKVRGLKAVPWGNRDSGGQDGVLIIDIYSGQHSCKLSS
jgi:hypothetical protein